MADWRLWKFKILIIKFPYGISDDISVKLKGTGTIHVVLRSWKCKGRLIVLTKKISISKMMCDVPVSNSNQFFYVRPRDDTLNNLIIKLNEEISQIGYKNHCGFLLSQRCRTGPGWKIGIGNGWWSAASCRINWFQPCIQPWKSVKGTQISTK